MEISDPRFDAIRRLPSESTEQFLGRLKNRVTVLEEEIPKLDSLIQNVKKAFQSDSPHADEALLTALEAAVQTHDFEEITKLCQAQLRDPSLGIDQPSVKKSLEEMTTICSQAQDPATCPWLKLPFFKFNSPKDLQPTNGFMLLLLTSSRFQLFSEIVREAEKSSPVNKGMVFSGPHGIGKSANLYLVATYAYINRYPLVYIAECKKWTDKFNHADNSCNAPALYWLRMFFRMNEHSLETFNFPSTTIQQLSTLRSEGWKKIDGAKNLQDDITSLLSEFEETPVFFLFDEHNELWRPIGQDPEKRISFKDIPYFSYINWTGQTSGPRTFTIYCGSAHSKFENNLPGGEDKKIRYIIPLSHAGFSHAIRFKNSPLRIDFNKVGATETELDLLTGRLPNEIQLLCMDQDKSDYFQERFESYHIRLVRLLNDEMDKDSKDRFLVELERFFALGFVTGLSNPPNGKFLDKGLVFKDQKKSFQIINEPAKEALRRIYVEASKITPLSPTKTVAEQGYLLERWILKAILKGEVKTSCFPWTTNISSVTKTLLSLNVKRHAEFCLADTSSLTFLNRQVSTVFVPSVSNFPLIDLICFCSGGDDRLADSIWFFQISMSTAAAHINKNSDEYYELKKWAHQEWKTYITLEKKSSTMEYDARGDKSFGGALLDLILSQEGHKCTFESRESEPAQLKFINPIGQVMHNIHVVYAIGLPENEASGLQLNVKKSKKRKTGLGASGVLLLTRKELEKDFQIPFQESSSSQTAK